MPLRITSAVLVVAGLVLLGLAAFSYMAAPAEPGLVVETDVQVEDCTAGQRTEFAIPLHNTSGRAIRVLGWGFC